MTTNTAAEAFGSFPGYGEDAGLELPALSSAATAALVGRIRDRSFEAFADAAAAVGYCARPVRLHGSSTTIDTATGEVLDTFTSADAPLGVVHVPCGNRRASVCPACSRVYARDTYEVIRTGVQGGKTVPAEVGENPLVFATLTAPSFGHVHSMRNGGRCRPRDRSDRCVHGRIRSCFAVHDEGDPVVGAPICSACYDHDTAIVWQWWAPELWRRFTITLKRHLATALHVPSSRLKDVASVQYAKVAEYQARGAIHFHALIRLDGPDGPGSRAPDVNLARLVERAAAAVSYTAPPVDEDDDVPRVLRFGAQTDIRLVTAGRRTDDPDAELTAGQVAGYLAKYASKGAADLTADRRHRPHLAALRRTCEDLAERAADHHAATGVPSPYLLLARWVHMLGFRGHFATKSRRYSITLGQLRRARRRFQAWAARARQTGRPFDTADLEARLLADDEDDTTLVIGTWSYAGTGWSSDGETALALAAAARAREYGQWKAARH